MRTGCSRTWRGPRSITAGCGDGCKQAGSSDGTSSRDGEPRCSRTGLAPPEGEAVEMVATEIDGRGVVPSGGVFEANVAAAYHRQGPGSTGPLLPGGGGPSGVDPGDGQLVVLRLDVPARPLPPEAAPPPGRGGDVGLARRWISGPCRGGGDRALGPWLRVRRGKLDPDVVPTPCGAWSQPQGHLGLSGTQGPGSANEAASGGSGVSEHTIDLGGGPADEVPGEMGWWIRWPGGHGERR